MRKQVKTAVKWSVAAVAFALIAVILTGCFLGWFGEKKEIQAELQPHASVVDGDGNELADGEVHPMPVRMLFAMSSLAEDTSVTVEATVKPENATNKAVDWSVKWADDGASWASGKTVTDYVTVTPTEDGSTTATVKNIAAFGEQVIITVASRDNPEASATCNVDYLQRIESATLKIGDVNVNFGGDTNVTVLVGKNTGGAGGTVTLEKNLATVYTIAETYTEKVSFKCGENPSSYDDYIAYSQSGSMGSMSKVTYDDIENAVGRSIYFDRRLFTDYNFKYESSSFVTGETQSSSTPFSEFDAEYINNMYFTNRQNKKFWDITVTFTGTHKTYTYTSALRWAGIDTTVPVSAIEMKSQDVLF